MKERPNIVIVLADDMGYGDAGCYNPESKTKTPYIDKLAEEGTLFTDAHSGCALCSPTRYGIISGTHMWRTEKKHALYMPYDPSTLPTEDLSIADVLKSKGYDTALVGKWHLGLNYQRKAGAMEQAIVVENRIDFAQPIERGPLDYGFDYFFGSAGCSTSDPPYAYIENRHTIGIPYRQSPNEWNVQPGFYPGLVADDWAIDEVDTTFTEKAVEFIDGHCEESPDKPFFLHFCLNTPHIPWVAPEFIRGTSEEGPRGDMNALADWALGQVYQALARNSILDDTLLIFTSDNGPQCGENGHSSAGPLRGFKNSAFEGGHRVPFIARWPERITHGETSDCIVSLTDLMATFAELVDFDIPETAAPDSMSFLPALLNDDSFRPTHAMVNTTGGFWSDNADFAIRKDNWKLIVQCERRDRPEERLLFDLDADISESKNLMESHPEIAAELESMLKRVQTEGTKHIRWPA